MLQETITANVSEDAVTLEFQRSDGTLITQLMDFRNVSAVLIIVAFMCVNCVKLTHTSLCSSVFVFFTRIYSMMSRLRVFENRVFRRMFGSKRDGVTGERRKLHNEELNDLYSSPSIVRVIKSGRMRWAGHVARMEEGRGVHKVLVGKPEGKRPLGRPRRRWEDNIKMDL